ncbi:MAG: hypothetical protein MUC83_13815 [Pirellula sp.]|jgi:hypothetical protein|nr:hypothetical protein [Pirellula sp.]
MRNSNAPPLVALLSLAVTPFVFWFVNSDTALAHSLDKLLAITLLLAPIGLTIVCGAWSLVLRFDPTFVRRDRLSRYFVVAGMLAPVGLLAMIFAFVAHELSNATWR